MLHINTTLNLSDSPKTLLHVKSRRHTIVLLMILLLVALLTLFNSGVKSSPIINKNLYHVGFLENSGFTYNPQNTRNPISNPTLTSLLFNGSESYLLASNIERWDVSVSVQQLEGSVYAMFYILEYFETVTNTSLGQYILVSGRNNDGQAASFPPPYIMTVPVPIYIYTQPGMMYNPFSSSSRIKYMTCVYSCMILTSDGKVYIHMGMHESSTTGRWLPIFDFTEYQNPDFPNQLTNVTIVSVAIGGYYDCETYFAVTNWGHVFSYGCYNSGARGTSQTLPNDDTTTIKIIPSLSNITSINSGKTLAGLTAVGAIDFDGVLWTWGSNEFGLLGLNDVTNTTSEIPRPVTSLPSKVVKIQYARVHALTILDNGDVYMFGDNTFKQCDPSSSDETIWIPRKMPLVTGNVTDCFATSLLSACILESGQLFSWGYTFSTSIGHPEEVNYGEISTDGPVTRVYFSEFHGIAMTSNGNVNVWGSDGNGLLTMNTEVAVRFPRKLSIPSIPPLSNVSIRSAKSTKDCSIIISEDQGNASRTSKFDFWGECSEGILFEYSSKTPVTYNGLSILDKGIVDLDVKTKDVIALVRNGDVYGWNRDNAGDGMANLNVLYSNVEKITAGQFNRYLLLKNGSLVGVGDNTYLQMGFGVNSSPEYPSYTVLNTSFLQPVEKIVDIASDTGNVFVLTNMGNVYGCGNNGNEKFLSASSETKIGYFIRINGNVKVRKIFLGFYSSLIMVSTIGKAYYFYGIPIPLNLPLGDSYVTFAFSYSKAYYFITKQGNVYTAGPNRYYETSQRKSFSPSLESPELYSIGSAFDGIPYMGFASEFKAVFITGVEYSCFGINSTHSSVCSSHGYCSALNECICDEGFYGSQCNFKSCFGSLNGVLSRPSTADKLCSKINKLLLN